MRSLPLLASFASLTIDPRMFERPDYYENHYRPPNKGQKRRRTGKIAANRAKAKAARQARKR